ncbi:hypothetical protein [Novipirellula rosea]|uniref:Uncharacterized protein n=1 Tax=Novipirellula rosea TaxID=1031540 RepID=A0ABP8NP64_9BACT
MRQACVWGERVFGSISVKNSGEVLLDYEEEESDADVGPPAAGTRKKSKKKKPWRLRWPDEFRDEVLARLLELNEQRHHEEWLGDSGQLLEERKAKSKKKKGENHKKTKPTPLFENEND